MTPKLTLTGSATITTDYLFRSISNTKSRTGGAARIRSDLWHVLCLYLGVQYRFGDGIELDYGIGITPKWKGITFNIAGLDYTYPGANIYRLFRVDDRRLGLPSASWTLGVNNYWSPNNFQFFGTPSMRSRVRSAMPSPNKLGNFFSPSLSGTVGPPVRMNTKRCIPDYTYWNAGLTLGFLDRLVRRRPLLRYRPITTPNAWHRVAGAQLRCAGGRHRQGHVLGIS